MHHKGRFPNAVFGVSLRPENAVVAIMILLLSLIFLFLFITLTATPAQGQTFNVIYNFTGGADGAFPCAGLISDTAGNLYGTTSGTAGCETGANSGGTVFRLSKKGSGWIFTPLYAFRGGADGASPLARVIIGQDGSLYGTTYSGGGNGCGTVFKLHPPAHTPPSTLGGWTETVLYRFSASGDGCGPSGDLVFDQAGNIYGTTIFGGNNPACEQGSGCGTVFQLATSGSNWTETVLHSFGGDDGAEPWFSGVTFDRTGNLYGTTVYGGRGGCEFGPCGNVFQLTPSQSGWTENVLYDFQGQNDGAQPIGSLMFDQYGNLYGATAGHGTGGGGTVGWAFNMLYSFAGREFEGPYAGLVMDVAGNLYGTPYGDDQYGCYGVGCGSVFRLHQSGGWTFTSLHDFTGGSDGANPISSVVVDANGNLYGTASWGGTGSACFRGCGVVWEITP